MLSKNLRLLFFLLFLFSCARKGIPPSPDRFAPRLKRLEVQDMTHLLCRFSEPLDSLSIKRENFSITSGEDTLNIRFIIQRDKNTLLLLTQPQKRKDYLLSLRVADTAGNIASIKKRFRGSLLPDTIPPRIVSIHPCAGKTKVLKGVIKVSFSEPMDTLSPLCFIFVKGVLKKKWNKNQNLLILTFEDTLKGVSYFLLPPLLTDLSHNPLFLGTYTYFTSDSILPRYPVYGRVYYKKSPISNAMLLFYNKDTLKALALSDLLGEFSLKIREGEYRIECFADTSRDGWIDLLGDYPRFIPSQETLSIYLKRPERRLGTCDLIR